MMKGAVVYFPRSGSVLLAIFKCFHRYHIAAHFTLMGAISVVVFKPIIKVLLECFDIFVDLLSKRDLVEFLKDCLVESPHIR